MPRRLALALALALGLGLCVFAAPPASEARLRAQVASASAAVEAAQSAAVEAVARARTLQAEEAFLRDSNARSGLMRDDLRSKADAEKRALENARRATDDFQREKTRLQTEERQIGAVGDDLGIGEVLEKEVGRVAERAGFQGADVGRVVGRVAGGFSLGVVGLEGAVEGLGVPKLVAVICSVLLWVLPLSLLLELCKRALKGKDIMPYFLGAYVCNGLLFSVAAVVVRASAADAFASLSASARACLTFAWATEVVFLAVVIAHAVVVTSRAGSRTDVYAIAMHGLVFASWIWHVIRVLLPRVRFVADGARVDNGALYLLHAVVNFTLAAGVFCGDFNDVYPVCAPNTAHVDDDHIIAATGPSPDASVRLGDAWAKVVRIVERLVVVLREKARPALDGKRRRSFVRDK